MTEQTEPQQTEGKPTAPDPVVVRDAVTRQAVLGALLDEVKSAYKDAKTAADDLLDKAYKAGGTTKFDALLPDGTKVGSSSRQGGEREAQVVDAEAFRVWVRDTFPTEHVVEFVPAQVITTVRPGFAGKVLAEATAAGTAKYVDAGTGEVHDVPGVELKPSRAASHRLTYTRGSKAQPASGRDMVAAAWRAGALVEHLPALAPAAPPAAQGDAA
ncbi:host nuclease inhibitor [Streptomyces phage SoJo]|nr:host nuclease inhibitor [Streptomyces phage SoJo]